MSPHVFILFLIWSDICHLLSQSVLYLCFAPLLVKISQGRTAKPAGWGQPAFSASHCFLRLPECAVCIRRTESVESMWSFLKKDLSIPCDHLLKCLTCFLPSDYKDSYVFSSNMHVYLCKYIVYYVLCSAVTYKCIHTTRGLFIFCPTTTTNINVFYWDFIQRRIFFTN